MIDMNPFITDLMCAMCGSLQTGLSLVYIMVKI